MTCFLFWTGCLDITKCDWLAILSHDHLAALILGSYVTPMTNRSANIQHGFNFLAFEGFAFTAAAASGRIVLTLIGLQHRSLHLLLATVWR